MIPIDQCRHIPGEIYRLNVPFPVGGQVVWDNWTPCQVTPLPRCHHPLDLVAPHPALARLGCLRAQLTKAARGGCRAAQRTVLVHGG